MPYAAASSTSPPRIDPHDAREPLGRGEPVEAVTVDERGERRVGRVQRVVRGGRLGHPGTVPSGSRDSTPRFVYG